MPLSSLDYWLINDFFFTKLHVEGIYRTNDRGAALLAGIVILRFGLLHGHWSTDMNISYFTFGSRCLDYLTVFGHFICQKTMYVLFVVWGGEAWVSCCLLVSWAVI